MIWQERSLPLKRELQAAHRVERGTRAVTMRSSPEIRLGSRKSVRITKGVRFCASALQQLSLDACGGKEISADITERPIDRVEINHGSIGCAARVQPLLDLCMDRSLSVARSELLSLNHTHLWACFSRGAGIVRPVRSVDGTRRNWPCSAYFAASFASRTDKKDPSEDRTPVSCVTRIIILDCIAKAEYRTSICCLRALAPFKRSVTRLNLQYCYAGTADTFGNEIRAHLV